ncbi:hypothetical protein P7D22_10705 [Lichenihabitans sp. Uapishka_5]|uniref:hypothetical protein n=1 Tax=Lichenihabitans sp. Uapishka_5 TaxID=3037302 RepID=UPI0029E828E4|nr:hypothetical protein [Lichenihabitans sp. Uapishka_5]MDX7951637.1 hypothetical protein [Lichenihabitans sp. Uapishka_5]
MTASYDDPTTDEKFYARALGILVGPSRRMALVMRCGNLAYWLSVMAALGWLASQVIDRDPPVTIRAATVLTPHLRPGDPVRVSYTLTRFRTCATDLTWSIYDGAGEIHSFGPLHIEAAGLPAQETYTRAWATPPQAAPGSGRLRVVLAFQCPGNYLQTLYPVTLVLPDLPIHID